jgi:hypothetical protein
MVHLSSLTRYQKKTKEKEKKTGRASESLKRNRPRALVALRQANSAAAQLGWAAFL